MNRHSILPSFVALVAVLASPAARAQATSATPVSDADALAAQMRIIAAQPTDIDALAQAGELSTRLGDLSGAASLFARANKIDPRNGRIKAGMAEVLLRSERPGEALRSFDQAEGYGYPAARFTAERGLAYDLVGQQGRAQRDYRQVLAADDTPEVRRRYALSLGISGQGEAALQELDPLIRRGDRGAWRSRAFIVAMQGDVAAATTIATTMMAPGQAQGLAPFFARLASLGPVDRAFAVHFGELRPTAQRLADARLAPALSPLAPETVLVARAAPVAVPVRAVDRRHRRKGEVQLAAAIPLPAPMARPPAYGIGVPAPAAVAAASRPVAPVTVARPATTAIVARPATTITVARPASTAIVARPATTVGASVAPPARVPGPKIAFYVPGSLLPRYAPRSSPAPVATAAAPGGTQATAIATPAVATPAVAMPTGTVVSVPTAVPRAIAPATVPLPQPIVVLAQPVVTPAPLPVPAAVVAATASRSASPTAGVAPPSVIGGSPSSAAPLASTGVPSLPATVTTAAAIPVTAPPVAAPPVTRHTPAPVTATTADVPPGSSDANPAPVAAETRPPAVRELAAPPVAAPATSIVGARAATPTPARPALSSDFPDTPMVVNGQLTDAGRAVTARRRVPEVAAAPLAPPTTAKTGTAEHPARSGASGSGRGTDSAADRTTSRSARRELAATDTAEPAPTRSRRRRVADKAAADETAADAPAPVDRKTAARQAAALHKAVADRKAAAEAKAQADQDAADEHKARKAEPERYWVQVAGGANEGDLAKAWSSTKAKAAALAGRKGWSTPLRATNRVITGPFKTDEEARAFVNTLKRQGVSAFPFTSEAGQKITRLDAK